MNNSGLVLGIESSCDDTAAAVVERGRRVLSSVVCSQAAQHAQFGGVVPEVAGRGHLEAILPTIESALQEAGVTLRELDAIAVTARPGLIGSLLVGLSTAKALALSTGLPIVDVHHIEAHVYAATMDAPEEGEGAIEFPCLALVVSGGHTALYHVESPLAMQAVASTLDDAAGEAFDKVAAMLGLPYPGGPSISKLATEGRADAIRFPRYSPKRGPGEPQRVGFSFSGVKTSVLYHLRGGDALAPTPAPDDIPDRADVAASFQECVVDALVKQTLRAAEQRAVRQVLVAGGVACNLRLREVMLARAQRAGIRAYFPAPAYCTDNAVMIAGLGYRRLEAGLIADLGLNAAARA